MKALFQPGAVAITQGAIALLKDLQLDPSLFLANHLTGNWGNLTEQDKQANEDALKEGGRILSVYGTDDDKIYIITEADRSSTTILKLEEH